MFFLGTLVIPGTDRGIFSSRKPDPNLGHVQSRVTCAPYCEHCSRVFFSHPSCVFGVF